MRGRDFHWATVRPVGGQGTFTQVDQVPGRDHGRKPNRPSSLVSGARPAIGRRVISQA
jgi:hypothetical protein